MMFEVASRRLLVTLALLVLPAAIVAQKPTAIQVQEALANNPSLAAKVRAKIGASGLSPDQVRARLKAAGYPENLLDAYMGDSTGTAPEPGNDAVNAATTLGLLDAGDRVEKPALGSAIEAKKDTQVVKQEEAKGDQIFGLDVFRRSTSQFEPDLAGPVDDSYKIGPHDVLALILTGGIENSYSLEVTREGFVVVPQAGQVYVANLTLEQASDVVFRRLQSVYSNIGRGPGAATRFYLTVAKLRQNQVFVIGDAQAPGSYQVSSAGTMLTALYAAGGPSDNGTLRSIELRRNGRSVGTLDIYDYLTKGDASHDLRLETGDVLFVPVHGARVKITGQIVRPAIYELRPGETLRDLLQMSGGFTAEASRRRVLVRRILPPSQRTDAGRDRTVLDVASDDFATGSAPTLPLADGDVVEVLGVADRVRNEVKVAGAVWTPGSQGYTTGMKLSDAIRQAGGVKPDVRDVLITRLQSDQSRIQLRAQFRDTLGTLVQDMPLQEDDSIQVYGASDFRPDRYVVITGAVNNGGKFPWREGMTLRDLVQMANGLDDGAYLGYAEVARLPEDRSSGVLSVTVQVPLDSSYLFERGLNGKYNGPPGVPIPSREAPDVAVQPYDNVLILRQPDWQLNRTVVLTGEVKFPGSYALKSKYERVSDLIDRAGGLLPKAYMGGAVFVRGQDGIGRIGVDLESALRDKNSRDDMILMPGDTLYIPQYRPTVKVEGAVNSPIAVAYVPGKNLNYYIDAAGGMRYDADEGRAYVRQPNGVVDPYKSRIFLLPDHKPQPDAGATVVVPTKDPNDKKDYTAIATAVAQVIAGTAAIIAIALRK